MASCDTHGQIKLWMIQTGKEVASLAAKEGYMPWAVLSPDGKTLAYAGVHEPVWLWDVNTKKLLAIFVEQAGFLAFSPNGRFFATASADNLVRLWDVKVRKLLAVFQDHAVLVWGGTTCLAFNSESNLLASAGRDGNVVVWDLARLKRRFTFTDHRGIVNAVTFSPDGKTLASAGKDKFVFFWDPVTGKKKKGWDLTNKLFSGIWFLAYAPDGKHLALAGFHETGMVHLWDVAKEERVASYHGHRGYIHGLIFAPDGSFIATCGEDRTVRLWLPNKEATVPGSKGFQVLAFSPDGKTAAGAGLDGRIKVCNRRTGKEVATLVGHKTVPLALVFSGDRKTLISVAQDEPVRVWDTSTWKLREVIAECKTNHTCLAVSPDGKAFAFLGQDDGKLTIWDLAKRRQRLTLTDHNEKITCLAFSGDGKTLASAGYENIYFWDSATGKQTRVMNLREGFGFAFTAIGLSQHGKKVAFLDAFQWVVRLRSVSEKTSQATFYANAEPTCVAFTSDGKMVACGVRNKNVRVWDIGDENGP